MRCKLPGGRGDTATYCVERKVRLCVEKETKEEDFVNVKRGEREDEEDETHLLAVERRICSNAAARRL